MVLRTLSNANEKFFYDILGLKQGRALKILKIITRPYSCACFLCVKLISKENFFCDILCSKERAAENATDPKNNTFFRENTEGAYAVGSKGVDVDGELAFDFVVTTTEGTERIAKLAYEYARNNKISL